MLSLRLDPHIERRLAKLAHQTGRTMSFHARELIEEHIKGLEERCLAEARLKKGRRSLTSRGVRKQLGLEH